VVNGLAPECPGGECGMLDSLCLFRNWSVFEQQTGGWQSWGRTQLSGPELPSPAPLPGHRERWSASLPTSALLTVEADQLARS
jgi:hypothetical protein